MINDATKLSMIEAETDQLIAEFRERLHRAFDDGPARGDALFVWMDDACRKFRYDPTDKVSRVLGELMTIGLNTVVVRLNEMQQ